MNKETVKTERKTKARKTEKAEKRVGGTVRIFFEIFGFKCVSNDFKSIPEKNFDFF